MNTGKRWTVFALVAGALAMALTAAACGGGAKASTVRVVAQEWSFQPSVASVGAGTVTFEVVNQGKQDHELVILKTDLPDAALKMRASEDKVDEGASGTNVGEVEDIEAGHTKTGSFALTVGRYVFLCNIAGHYKSGMVKSFDVK